MNPLGTVFQHRQINSHNSPVATDSKAGTAVDMLSHLHTDPVSHPAVFPVSPMVDSQDRPKAMQCPMEALIQLWQVALCSQDSCDRINQMVIQVVLRHSNQMVTQVLLHRSNNSHLLEL